MKSLKKFWEEFGVITVIAVIALWVLSKAPYDNTDDIENKERSGMGLYTDHLTGCQYLSRALGGLTPRLHPDGSQVCLKPQSTVNKSIREY